MTDAYAKSCDEVRLNLFLDGELGANETQWMEAHIKDCTECRKKAATIVAFTRTFRRRVQEAVDTVDFVGLEKEVLKKTLPRYVPQSAWSNALDVIKFFVPITLIAGFLLFFIYTRYIDDPDPVPSAIVESFSGAVESVMMFETKSRETILWYNENTDMENENDAI